MKTYKVIPAVKKSLIETRFWRKDSPEGNLYAEYEIGWRSGSFLIHVPETEEDIKEWLEYRGITEEDLEYVNFLPNEDDEQVELDDYYYEMLDTWDGNWSEWRVTASDSLNMTEEEISELTESIEEGYNNDWEEHLLNDGWEELGTEYIIVGGVIIEEYEE